MSAELICASHTPLLHVNRPEPEVETEVGRAFDELKRKVDAFAPDLVVVFGCDHFNGFFYDNMPSFAVGVRGRTVGDYGLPVMPLRVPEADALACVDALRAEDIDVAVSYDMRLDHGFVQTLELMAGTLDRFPVLPIFINAAAKPLPTCRRTRMLGEAVGRFAAGMGKRVLLMGSGGLSHDPPTPQIATASDEAARILIQGGSLITPEIRAVREERVRQVGLQFVQGEGPCRPLNPDWDRDFLGVMRSGDLGSVDGFDDDWIDAKGGRGAQEVRTWIAAFAALGVAGRYEVDFEYYRAIPTWIAGMAMVHAAARPG